MIEDVPVLTAVNPDCSICNGRGGIGIAGTLASTVCSCRYLIIPAVN